MRTFSIFNRNNSFSGLFFVIVCSSLMILDSIIVRIYANIPTEPPQILSLLLFGGLFVFLIFSNYILFRNARLYPLSPKRNSYGFPKLWYNLVVLNQILICGLIGSITLSILVFGGYNIIALSIIIYLSVLLCCLEPRVHDLSIFFMVHEKAKLPCFDVCICIFDSNNELTCVHRVSEQRIIIL